MMKREEKVRAETIKTMILKSVFCYDGVCIANMYGVWCMVNGICQMFKCFTYHVYYFAPISIFGRCIRHSAFGTGPICAHSSWFFGSFFILFVHVWMFISDFSFGHETEYIFTIVFNFNGRISFGVWPCDTRLNMHFILCGFYCDVDFSFRLTLISLHTVSLSHLNR